MIYIYNWANNEKRKTLKGRKCKVLARGKMNSCLIEFENGQQECISRNALRKAAKMRHRRHHNNKGYRQIKNGNTEILIRRLRKKFGVKRKGGEE